MLMDVSSPEFRSVVSYAPISDYKLVEADGRTLSPMDEPYCEYYLREPGVWQIKTAGDYMYLVEGETEAILIDTGDGATNLQAVCRQLTDKPVTKAIVTHEHADHYLGCHYFETVYMSEKCKETVTDPSKVFPPYNAIEWPLNYEIVTVGDGYIFDLGGRQLEVFDIPDHAAGSIALLDRKNKLLFSGDELGTPAYKEIQTTVSQFAANVDKLYANFDDIMMIYGGGFVYDRMHLHRLKMTLERIIKDGDRGFPWMKQIPPEPDYGWPKVRRRQYPSSSGFLPTNMFERRMLIYGYCTVIFDEDKI